MKILKNPLIALVLISPIFSPCSAFAFDLFKNKDVIWEASANEYFKYVKQDTSSFGKNDHPVELEAKEIGTILDSIKIREEDNLAAGEKIKSIFSAQQTSMLGEYLAKGLKTAKPNQDIIFAMERSVDRFIGLKPDRFFVAGRVFYKDNKLNIIIGDYDLPRRDGFEAAYDPTHTGIVRYHLNHGNRSKPSKFKQPFTSIKGVDNKLLKNARRSDWFVIDVNEASKAYDHMTKMRQKEEMAQKRKELKEIMGSEEIDRYEYTSPREETNHLRKTTRSLEERLTELKQLRNKDLITEEEYAQKRKQMLDDL